MSKVRFCEICKQAIEPERIDFSPETRLCRTHAVEIEQYGGEFIMRAEQERTSKAGSLKINYGGVTTSRTRNEEAVRKLREAYDA